MTEPDWRLMQRLWERMLEELQGMRAEMRALRENGGPFVGPGAQMARELEDLRQRLERLEETVHYPGKPGGQP